ncbi:hypothetical protein [Luteimonas sp. MC1750]|uniref:hypothetical protein n=1 Tax=Luteimonas sp. MC1750 TaxID=2799326 RepID=UPI0018F0724C|nr:hypothetical protein [Luteimonas sp. MC1750]MBJ6985632.1 hypothetical protein [Luteimonas sp. MC1750]QQO06113.1 hypothetical protein JGR68_01260 [Luteimonas sp. MC1750]
MKAIAAILLLMSTGALAQQAVNPVLVLQIKADACKKAGIEELDGEGLSALLDRFGASGERRTPDEWGCAIVGTLNRAQTVKVLGKPTRSMGGMVFFKDKARDPDTDDPLTLQVVFLNGTDMPATHVTHVASDN